VCFRVGARLGCREILKILTYGANHRFAQIRVVESIDLEFPHAHLFECASEACSEEPAGHRGCRNNPSFKHDWERTLPKVRIVSR
jgi:hypothetical protein